MGLTPHYAPRTKRAVNRVGAEMSFVFGDSVFGDSVFGDSFFGDIVFGDSGIRKSDTLGRALLWSLTRFIQVGERGARFFNSFLRKAPFVCGRSAPMISVEILSCSGGHPRNEHRRSPFPKLMRRLVA
jgi:hypothetical protein